MISIRQYQVLKELKISEEKGGIISKDDVLRELKNTYGEKKYTDEVLNAEIKELEQSGNIKHSDSIWRELTPAGKLLVNEYWKRWVLETAKYLLFHIAIPVATSLITTLITMYIKG